MPWQWPQPYSPLPEVVAQFGVSAAQLLAQRGITTLAEAMAFCQPEQYQPQSVWAFAEMELAVTRLLEARDRAERVWIWGDFDADGITATAVLWQGLGWVLPQLNFFVPNRFTESHGVSVAGIQRLQAAGCDLIVTCDTGSTSLEAIAYAQSQGIDVIITDHHTLPSQRPPVVAMLNPRSFAADHPMATLSGVAVAYALVQALLERCPEVESQAETLLDLVAIGLIADVVELRGDVRYLAQLGIERLKMKARVGVALLLEQCNRSGDRAMDVAFGLGPRINAVSRMHGDVSFCIEMLTSSDPQIVKPLVEATELANSRRKALQRQVSDSAIAQLEHYDLDQPIIVLASADWPAGVLGPVAGQLTHTYHRPVVLLSLGTDGIASGSARSVAGIDLYGLLESQADFLLGFGGHPLAAGLRLEAEHIDHLRHGLNHYFRQHFQLPEPTLAIDLSLSVADLTRDLFYELKKLEPFGMGNPYPKIVLKQVRLTGQFHRNLKDAKGQKVQYIRTFLRVSDATGHIDGVWWGHYSYELPQGEVDAVVELDVFSDRQGKFQTQIRLIAFQASAIPKTATEVVVLDARPPASELAAPNLESSQWLRECPSSWRDFDRYSLKEALVLAYAAPPARSPVWPQLVGWAKSLAQSGDSADLQRWVTCLDLPTAIVMLGLETLAAQGWQVSWLSGQRFQIRGELISINPDAIAQFEAAIAEFDFQRQYFATVSPEIIAITLSGAIATTERIQAE